MQMSSNINRKIPPAFGVADRVTYLHPKAGQLSNGMPVYLVEGVNHEVLKMEFVFKTGSYHQKKPLVAYAAANLLKTGTVNKTSEEINYILDFYGASFQADVQKDIISLTVYCLSRYLKPILELLTELVTCAVFPQQEIDILLKNMLHKYIVNQKKVQHVARMQFSSLLYGKDHPYGRLAVEQDYSSVSREDILDYYHEFFHPQNAFCIIAGKYPADITELMDQVMQKYSWMGRPEEITPVYQIAATADAKHSLTIPDAVQSSVRIGKLMVNRNHPDYHLITVANALLGGYFGSRLMQNIRQDKGYTYGINSGVVTLIHSAYFYISTQVGNDVRDKAVEEIYNELCDLRNKPAGDQELNILRNYLSANLLRSFDGPFQQSERFKEILLFKLDYSHFDRQNDTLKSFSAADIQQMAEKYFHEKDMIELVVG
jgi:zinc protease